MSADKLPSIPLARQAIDVHVLSVAYNGLDIRTGETHSYFPFSAFITQGLSKEIVRGVLRDLTDSGLCEYRAGLFRNDGEVGGAGYGITQRGAKRYFELAGEEAPEGVGKWWSQLHEVAA